MHRGEAMHTPLEEAQESDPVRQAYPRGVNRGDGIGKEHRLKRPQTVGQQALRKLEILWAKVAIVLAVRAVFHTDTEAERIYQ